MQILHPATSGDFLALAGDFLSRHEAEHGLMLGVARAVPTPPPNAYFGVVVNDGMPVAAAMRLDWRLIVSRAEVPDAMALLAGDAASPLLRTVLGPSESVARFTSASAEKWRAVMAQGIYECRAVTPPPRVEGARRLAVPNDRDLLAAWLRRFSAEALHETVTDADALMAVDGHIDAGHFHVWESGGRTVSLAAAVAPTIHGIRINHVYTPPEIRGRGYASALVSSLTQSLLTDGYRFAFLHTDLANPTSNRIYMRIGYRQVATFQVAEW